MQAETIGVEVLRGRFEKYMEFLEEHEVVEDQMLFPLVKALFPQVRVAVRVLVFVEVVAVAVAAMMAVYACGDCV